MASVKSNRITVSIKILPPNATSWANFMPTLAEVLPLQLLPCIVHDEDYLRDEEEEIIIQESDDTLRLLKWSSKEITIKTKYDQEQKKLVHSVLFSIPIPPEPKAKDDTYLHYYFDEVVTPLRKGNDAKLYYTIKGKEQFLILRNADLSSTSQQSKIPSQDRFMKTKRGNK